MIPREDEGFEEISEDEYPDPYYDEYDYDSYEDDFEPDYSEDFVNIEEEEDDFDWDFEGIADLKYTSKPPDLSGFFRSVF